MHHNEWPLARVFSFLAKQYMGKLSESLGNLPIDRYYFPLYLIGKNSGKISQQELADLLLTDKVSLVRVLDALAKEGMIERVTNPNDRRQHLLSATPKALETISEIETGLRETNSYFFDLLPADKRKDFQEALSMLICKTKDIPADQFELFYNR